MGEYHWELGGATGTMQAKRAPAISTSSPANGRFDGPAAWGREANELYALAKMRLFRAFDEVESLVQERLNIVVDEQNLEDLLAPLGVV